MPADELKPKSFRINDETAKKFKEISNTIECSQQETLAKLIEAYEFQSGKAVLTNKKAEIEQFERYVNGLTRMYMGSLEENQDLSETVRTEFDALLQSKDDVIQDLQKRIKAVIEQKEQAETKAKACREENAELKKELESCQNNANTHIENLQTMLNDKDNLNQSLSDTCNNLKLRINSMEQEAQKSASLEKALSGMELKYEQAQKDSAFWEKETRRILALNEDTVNKLKQREKDLLKQQKEEAALALEKAVLKIEKKYQNEMLELKEQKFKEADNYQKRYVQLLESIQKQKEEAAKAEMQETEAEKTGGGK